MQRMEKDSDGGGGEGAMECAVFYKVSSAQSRDLDRAGKGVRLKTTWGETFKTEGKVGKSMCTGSEMNVLGTCV